MGGGWTTVNHSGPQLWCGLIVTTVSECNVMAWPGPGWLTKFKIIITSQFPPAVPLPASCSPRWWKTPSGVWLEEEGQL